MNQHDSPARVVERYVLEIYNEQRPELVKELCADPVVRHDPGNPGTTRELSHDEQIERISADLAKHRPTFKIVHLIGDDTHASLTWEAHRKSGGPTLSGIEIFEVHEGRVTDVWNAPYAEGTWG